MNKKNLLLTLLTITVMIGGTALGVFLVQGNTYDPQTGTILEKGVLSVNSAPNGAAIYINDRLQNATNTSIPFLTTGEYRVRLTKEGYIPWEKSVKLNNDTVTKIEAYLWPATPDPNPLTNTGVVNAVVSPDREKLVYAIRYSEDDKAGLWLLDMNKRAVFNNSTTSFTQLTRNSTKIDYSQATLTWSPDNTQVLATLTDADNIERNFLININQLNNNPSDITLTKNGLLDQWKTEYFSNITLIEDKIKDNQKAKQLIAESTVPVQWSYDNTLFLYGQNGKGIIIAASPSIFPSPTNKGRTAITTHTPSPASTATTTDPTQDILQLSLKERSYSEIMTSYTSTYSEGTELFVYDIKKDVSYRLPFARNYTWYPQEESAEREIQNLMMVEEGAISMIESDGQNKSTIYAALFEPDQVFLWPDGGRLIISANYNPRAGSEPNLYTINLR